MRPNVKPIDLNAAVSLPRHPFKQYSKTKEIKMDSWHYDGNSTFSYLLWKCISLQLTCFEATPLLLPPNAPSVS